MIGTSGALEGRVLLSRLQDLKCTGTLALRKTGGTMLLLLDKGQLRSSHKIGWYDALDAVGQDFRFDPHEAAELPTLAPLDRAANLPVLRALPRFGTPEPLACGHSDLRAHIAHLQHSGYTGALSCAAEAEAGVALFLRGRIVAASFERDGFRLERGDALRSLYRYSLGANPPLELDAHEPVLTRALVALALARPMTGEPATDFHGVETTEAGYTFWLAGEPCLRVAAERSSAEDVGPLRRYASVADDAPLPELHLPDDPPGWEERRFTLTLRGEDALNPMTQLAMHFGERYGESGRRILEALDEGLTIEQTANELGLDLEELKPWLRRLEEEGLVRSGRKAKGAFGGPVQP
jgi:hypothetical protein